MVFSATHPLVAHQSQCEEHFSRIISANSRLSGLFWYSWKAGAKSIQHQVSSQKQRQVKQPGQRRTAETEASYTLSAASAGWRLCILSLGNNQQLAAREGLRPLHAAIKNFVHFILNNVCSWICTWALFLFLFWTGFSPTGNSKCHRSAQQKRV